MLLLPAEKKANSPWALGAGGAACRGSASGEFILPAVPDAARTAVVDRRQLTGKMKSPALEKNTIGTASPRRTKVLTLAKASSVILGRCENAVTTGIRSFFAPASAQMCAVFCADSAHSAPPHQIGVFTPHTGCPFLLLSTSRTGLTDDLRIYG